MSLRFDARCACAGCGTPVRDYEKVMANGAHRVSTKDLGKGKREVVSEVETTCVACGSRRVRVVMKVDVGSG